MIEGKYENSEGLIRNGWTGQQVERYLGFIESADPETLREILKKTGVGMFRDDEPVDPQQSVFVLCRQSVVKKEEFFRVVDEYLE